METVILDLDYFILIFCLAWMEPRPNAWAFWWAVQLIGKAQIKHARIRHGSYISLGNEVIFMYPLKGIHDDENNVCFMTDDCISPLLPLALLMWHVRLLSLCVVVSQAPKFCLAFFCEGFVSMTSAQDEDRVCTLRLTHQYGRRPCQFPCIHSSYWLELSVSILNSKESYIFVGSFPVSVVSSSGTMYTERTLSHSQLDVESTPHFEMMNFQHPEVGFVETRILVLYWRWWPSTIKELRSELVLYQEMDLNRGSEFRIDLTNSWEIWQKRHEMSVTLRRFQQTQGSLSFKSRELWEVLKFKQANLQRRKKPKPTSNPLSSSSTEQSPIMKGIGLILSLKSTCPRMLRVVLFRRGWFHCSDTELFLEKKMEKLNSGDSRRISNQYPRWFWRKFCESVFTGQRVDPRELLRVRPPHRKCFEHAFHQCFWIIAGGKNHERCRQTVFFTAVDPMDKKWIDKGQHDLRNPRFAAYKQTWKIMSRCSILGWYLSCPKDGIEILPNKVECDHSPWHSSAEMHWKSGIQEVTRSPVHQNYKVATSCSDDQPQSKLAKRLEFWCGSWQQQLPTNPTKPTSKHGAARRFLEVGPPLIDKTKKKSKVRMKKLIKLTRGNPLFNAVACWSSESRGYCNQM